MRPSEIEAVDPELHPEFAEWVKAQGFDQAEYAGLWDNQKARLKELFIEAQAQHSAQEIESETPAAAAPREIAAQAFKVTCPAEIMGAETDKGLKQFTVRYNGGAIDDPRFHLPIVLDVAGLGMSSSLVATMNSDPQQIVGHIPASDATVDAGATLTLGGIVSGAGPAAEQFKASTGWHATIDAKPERIVEIPGGAVVTANGRTFTGPVLLAKKSKLFGCSFSTIGTDDDCVAILAVPPDVEF